MRTTDVDASTTVVDDNEDGSYADAMTHPRN
jgi:hypothetical protein